MATPLSIELTADIKKLEAELKKARKKLQDFEKGVSTSSTKTEKGFDKIGKGAKGASNSIDTFATTAIASVFSVAALSAAFVALAPKIKDFVLNLSDSQKALQSLNLETAKTIGAVKGEIAVLQSLLNVSRDETRSKEDRQRAINKINEEYKDLLPNLDLENVNTRKVTEAVDDLTNSLVRQAKIRGAQKLISEETAKILEIQANTALENLTALDALAAGFKSFGNFGFASANLVTAGLERQNKEISESEKRIANFTRLLQALIGEDVSKKGVFSSSKSIPGKTKATPLESPGTRIGGFAGGIVPEASGPIFGPLFANASKELSLFEKRLLDFQEISSGIINDGILDGFRALGDGIATALRGGGDALDTFALGVFNALGSFLTQLGEAAILTGIGMLSIKKAFTNPLAAIAAGAALVAAGALLSSAASSAPGGGANVGSTSGQGSGNFSGSTSISRSGGFSGGEVVFRIQGRSLVGVLNRELKTRNKTVSDVI